MSILFTDLNLSKPLQSALEDLGYTTPTTIQEKIFSVIMSGVDVCGIAQTGTGKTFAYLLPSLRLWKYDKSKMAQIIIVVPTRELAIQVAEEVRKLTTYMNCTCVATFGGVNLKPQALEVSNGLDVIVSTPGRLLDLMLDGYLKTKNLKRLIIDEVDEMLQLGFRPQLKSILDLLPEKRQNLLFSATLTPDVALIMQDYFNAPVLVEAAPSGTPLENIDQYKYAVPNFYTKINLLIHLLRTDAEMKKVVVFAATKAMVDDIYELLAPEFPEVLGVIHSNKSQNHRIATVKDFQSGKISFLLATDIIARGIDISDITHVISLDTPVEPEPYLHRIGRTGRATNKGISILLHTERELEYVQGIETLMKYEIPTLPLPEEVAISTQLTDDEQPKVKMKTFLVSMPKLEVSQGAFHEKKEKNKKVNVKVSHKDKMMQKYGKPKTRGVKKKKR